MRKFRIFQQILTPETIDIFAKRHYDSPADVNNEIFSTVRKLISRVDSLTGATLVAIHNGKDSGQEIPHVHVHLIPRSKDDSAGAVHSMFSKIPELSESEIDELCTKLRIS